MSTFDPLLANNAHLADTDAKQRVPEIPFLPHAGAYVITCIDPRVDPAQLLGLELGDAIVARNVGGRVTDAVLADLAWISYLHERLTPDAPWFELAVVHHTDCGSALMNDDALRAGFVERGFDDAALLRTAVVDPARTVAEDAARITAAAAVSDRIAVHGFTYDVRTGRLTAAVVPALEA